jgi:hypothetical protein
MANKSNVVSEGEVGMENRDPAFLFYDGDAARDVSHMNRLERGCYFDIIQAQRKFGKLSEQVIKKILGKDFDGCWEAVKMCLTYENHMYFIGWLEESSIKRREYSESRRLNRIGSLDTKSKESAKSYDKHMVNENKDGNVIVVKDKIPPGRIDLVDYFKEIGLTIEDSEAFYDHFESNGWKIGGKSPMKDWKASARTWKRNKEKYGSNRQGNQSSVKQYAPGSVIARATFKHGKEDVERFRKLKDDLDERIQSKTDSER